MVPEQTMLDFEVRSGIERVFFVRHGQYEGEKLTKQGIDNTDVLAEEMRNIIGGSGEGVYLLSSSALRAVQTAEIIADTLGLDDFYRENGLAVDVPSITRVARDLLDKTFEEQRYMSRIFIAVSHLGVVKDYPPYFMGKHFNNKKWIAPPNKAEAAHINMLDGSYEILPVSRG